MVNQVPSGDLIPPIILVILSGFLASYFFISRRKSGVNALDWFIAIFSSTTLMGILQLFKLFFEGEWGLFKYSSDVHSLIVNPVRFVHLIALLILYFMAEFFLNERPNSIRLGILSGLIGGQVILALLYVSTGKLIYTNEVFHFAQPTTLDGVLFDLMGMEISILLQYVYYKQYKVSSAPIIKRYLIVLNLALVMFNIGNLIEIAEHFLPIGDVNGFTTILPTFIILAVFYIRYPNFVYLAPTRIKFLQLISDNGELLYAVEITETKGSREFLVAPIFASVNSLIGELVGNENIIMKSYLYDEGVVLLEKLNEVQVIIQADRSAQILRRSMRYFIREFYKHFENQIQNFDGSIQAMNGIDPDEILRKCIPIVQSEVIISNYKKKPLNQ